LRRDDADRKKRAAAASTTKPSELERHRFVVNVDIQGARLGWNSAFAFGPPTVAASVTLLSAERGPIFRVSEDVYSSDNAPFGDAGVPSISFGRAGPANVWGHSPGDTIEHLDAEHLAMCGDFIAEYLRRYLAASFFVPFPREIPQDHKDKLARYFKDRSRIDAWQAQRRKAGTKRSTPRSSRR
jgi:Zn-dependent M28 family amino/carboxypeptidase